jgi:hypothetical protein
MPEDSKLAFLSSPLFWKIAGLIFLAGGAAYQLQVMNAQMENLVEQRNINARVHVYILQRLAMTAEQEGPLRPLTADELELIGLLQGEVR